MNIDNLEDRIKDMTDDELEAYLRDVRARRKNTIKPVAKAKPKAKAKAKPKAAPTIESLGFEVPEEMRAAVEAMLKEQAE